jgi:hypothetical protein
MSEHSAENDAPWNPHWNYALGGQPRSTCACPDGPYEGARHISIPRYCERCGGLVDDALAERVEAEQAEALRDLQERAARTPRVIPPVKP